MTTETTIKTEIGSRVHVSDFDDGGCWVRISTGNASISTMLTAAELDQLIKGLQAIQEVTK